MSAPRPSLPQELSHELPRELPQMAELATLFDAAIVAVGLTIGPDHRYAYVNPMFQQVTGHRDLLGLPFDEAFPELRGLGFRETLDGVYATGEVFTAQEVPVELIRRPGGAPELCYFTYTHQPMQDASGATMGVLTVGIEVTEKVEAAQLLQTASEALQAANEELETQNEELQSQNEELQTQQEELESQQEELQSLYEQLRMYSGNLEALVEARTQALAQEKRFSAQILQSAAEGIIGLDRDDRIRFVNQAAARLLGQAPEGLLDMPFFDLCPLDLAPGAPPQAATFPGRDGKTVAVELTRSPIESEDGLEGAVIMLRDVTERRRTEEVLRELAEGFSARATGEAFFHGLASYLARTLNVDLVLIGERLPEAQERVRTVGLLMDGQITGPMEYDLTGTPCENVVDAAMCTYRDNVQAVFPEDRELEALGVESYSGTPLRDTRGEVIGLIAVMHRQPLSEVPFVESVLQIVAKRAEAELERMRVQERMEAQAQALETANQQLLEADRHKDEFLSVISHELRTPLNFITGFASLLDDEVAGPLTPEQHAYLGRILRGSDRMLSLIGNLLDYAAMQVGRFSLVYQETDFGDLVAEVVETMRPLADQKRITLDHEVPVALRPRLDRDRIIQVLTNLLSNAIKFSDPDTVIHVRVRRESDGLVCEVQDQGVGVAEEHLERIFDKFTQLDMSATREAGGVGLGLTISKSLIESHHGAIGARSEPGLGSTFWFTLPLDAEASAP